MDAGPPGRVEPAPVQPKVSTQYIVTPRLTPSTINPTDKTVLERKSISNRFCFCMCYFHISVRRTSGKMYYLQIHTTQEILHVSYLDVCRVDGVATGSDCHDHIRPMRVQDMAHRIARRLRRTFQSSLFIPLQLSRLSLLSASLQPFSPPYFIPFTSYFCCHKQLGPPASRGHLVWKCLLIKCSLETNSCHPITRQTVVQCVCQSSV